MHWTQRKPTTPGACMRQDVCNNLDPEEQSAWRDMPASLRFKINKEIPASPTLELLRQACQHQKTGDGSLVIDTSDHLTAESGIAKSVAGDHTAKAGLKLQTTAGKAKPLCSEPGDAHPSVLLSDPKKRVCNDTGKSVGHINAKFHVWMTTTDDADPVVHEPPTCRVSERDV